MYKILRQPIRRHGMIIYMKISSIRLKILPILKKQGIKKAAIFGSFARGQERPESDIDLLLQFKNVPSLLEMADLKLKLEKKVGRKFDLLTYDGVNTSLRKIVLDEQKIIYEKRS